MRGASYVCAEGGLGVEVTVLEGASLSRRMAYEQCACALFVILRSPPFLLADDEGSLQFACKIDR
jgi:hypothetical protein